MALIKCPECGNEISDQATNCPRCGYPITKGKDRKQPAASRKVPGLVFAIVFIIISVLVFCVLGIDGIPIYGVDNADIRSTLSHSDINESSNDIQLDDVFNDNVGILLENKNYSLHSFLSGDSLSGEVEGYIVFFGLIVIVCSLCCIIYRKINCEVIGGFFLALGTLLVLIGAVLFVHNYGSHYNKELDKCIQKDNEIVNQPATIVNPSPGEAHYVKEFKAEHIAPEGFEAGSYKIGFYMLIVAFILALLTAFLQFYSLGTKKKWILKKE